MRKIIQIAISEGIDQDSSNSTQWSLCDDGTIWEYTGPCYETQKEWAMRVGRSYPPETFLRGERLEYERYKNERKLKDAQWKQIVGVPQDEI